MMSYSLVARDLGQDRIELAWIISKLMSEFSWGAFFSTTIRFSFFDGRKPVSSSGCADGRVCKIRGSPVDQIYRQERDDISILGLFSMKDKIAQPV